MVAAAAFRRDASPVDILGGMTMPERRTLAQLAMRRRLRVGGPQYPFPGGLTAWIDAVAMYSSAPDPATSRG